MSHPSTPHSPNIFARRSPGQQPPTPLRLPGSVAAHPVQRGNSSPNLFDRPRSISAERRTEAIALQSLSPTRPASPSTPTYLLPTRSSSSRARGAHHARPPSEEISSGSPPVIKGGGRKTVPRSVKLETPPQSPSPLTNLFAPPPAEEEQQGAGRESVRYPGTPIVTRVPSRVPASLQAVKAVPTDRPTSVSGTSTALKGEQAVMKPAPVLPRVSATPPPVTNQRPARVPIPLPITLRSVSTQPTTPPQPTSSTGTDESSSGTSSSRASSDEEKREEKGPPLSKPPRARTHRTPSFLRALRGGVSHHNPDVLAAMHEALTGKLVPPLLPVSAPPISEPPAPSVRVQSRISLETDIVTGLLLNSLFPNNGPVPEWIYRFDDDTEIPIDPLFVTPNQIDTLGQTEVERTRVTSLSFFRSGASDELMEALAKTFPNVTTISWALCPNLTDRAIAAIQNLPLTKISITLCPKLTSEGLTSLPISRVTHLSLATKEKLSSKFFQKVATQSQVSHLDLNFCPELADEDLAPLAAAQSLHLKIKECPQVTPEGLVLLNQERAQPITFDSGFADDRDRERVGLPRPHVPLRLFPKDKTFSIQGKKSLTLPTTPCQYISLIGMTPDKPDDFIGQFEALIQGSSASLEGLQIHRCPHLTREGLSAIRQLPKLRRLHLGRLPSLTEAGLEKLLSSDLTPFPHVEELYLTDLPVTDRALASIAQMPSLKKLVLANCTRYTVRGLTAISKALKQEEDPLPLKFLRFSGCRSVDQLAFSLFQRSHPEVTVVANLIIEPGLGALVIQETQRRLENEAEEFMKVPFCKEQEEDSFYQEMLQNLGIETPQYAEDEEGINLRRWHCNQLLQTYINVHRIAWAGILDPLAAMQYFSDQDRMPTTVQTIFELLKRDLNQDRAKELNSKSVRYDTDGVVRQNLSAKETEELIALDREEKNTFRQALTNYSQQLNQAELPYTTRFKSLDFSGLGITKLPSFILEENWPALREIKLKGTMIETLPPAFIEPNSMQGQPRRCPYLSEVHFPDIRYADGSVNKHNVHHIMAPVPDNKKVLPDLTMASKQPTSASFASLESLDDGGHSPDAVPSLASSLEDGAEGDTDDDAGSTDTDEYRPEPSAQVSIVPSSQASSRAPSPTGQKKGFFQRFLGSKRKDS